MKKFFKYLVPVVLIGLFAALTGCTGDTNSVNTPNVVTDYFSGVVRDAASGAPLAGVTVKNGVASAVTDKDGVFSLGGFTVGMSQGTVANPEPVYAVALSGLPTGYPSVAFRTINGARSGINDLRVGKQSGTIKGIILNNDASFATNAKVYLTYNIGQNTTVTNSTVAATTVTATDGSFTFNNIEVGSNVSIYAQDSTNAYTKVVTAAKITPLVEGFLINLPAVQFNDLPDTVQPLQTLTPTIAVGGTAATGPAEVAAGATVVKFTLTKAMAQTAFTDFSNAELIKTAFVNLAAKGGNVPFTITYDLDASTPAKITAINVNFTTAVNGVYTVNIGDATGATTTFPFAAGSFLQRIGVVGGRSTVTFATVSGTSAAGVPAIVKAPINAIATGTPQIDWVPTTGAVSYKVYRATTRIWPNAATATSITGDYDQVYEAPVAAKNNITNSYFTAPAALVWTQDTDIEQIQYTYSYKVTAVDANGVESAASNVITYADTTAPTVAVAPVVTTVAVRSIAVGTAITPAVTGKVTITFSEPMDEPTAKTLANYTFVLGAGALATDVVTLVPSKVDYNAATNSAILYYTDSSDKGDGTQTALTAPATYAARANQNLVVQGVKDVSLNTMTKSTTAAVGF